MPEQERLDPRLRSEPAMPATGQAVGSSSDPSTIPRSEEPDQVDGGSRPGDNREDGVRSLEFGASIGRH